MAAQILQGNVTDLLPTLKPGSVDCCVTSPPYWMLRSYLPKGHPLKAQELGSEPTPAASWPSSRARSQTGNRFACSCWKNAIHCGMPKWVRP